MGPYGCEQKEGFGKVANRIPDRLGQVLKPVKVPTHSNITGTFIDI
jgi:hypothetical protein